MVSHGRSRLRTWSIAPRSSRLRITLTTVSSCAGGPRTTATKSQRASGVPPRGSAVKWRSTARGFTTGAGPRALRPVYRDVAHNLELDLSIQFERHVGRGLADPEQRAGGELPFWIIRPTPFLVMRCERLLCLLAELEIDDGTHPV